MQLRVLDLFAGAGGMALGFRAAGFRCVGAVERASAASRTFQHNFASDGPRVFGGPEEGDVNNLAIDDLLAELPSSPDIIVGGPPCQGFSRVGRAKQASLLDDDLRVLRGGVRDPNRNQLYRYFLGAVAKARPLAFVMENVPGMREMLGIDHAGRIAREAAALGYNVRYFLLNAAWYGVPQERWRLFFVGLRSDLGPRAVPEPPERRYQTGGTQLEGAAVVEDRWMVCGDRIPAAKQLAPAVTVFDAIGDLPRLVGHLPREGGEPQRPVERRLPLRRTPSEWARNLRDWPGVPASADVSGNWYRWTARDFETFARMAQGDRYPAALRVASRRLRETIAADSTCDPDEARKATVPPYRNDAFVDKWRKLRMNAPSWTLTAHLGKDTYSHIHYDSRQARTITVREAARLQSFPDGFEFIGNMGERYRQIGNAVPPLLARALAERLRTQLAELGVETEAA